MAWDAWRAHCSKNVRGILEIRNNIEYIKISYVSRETLLYIILFIQYNGLEHTESDDKMVKEYLKEKADSLTAEKERLTAQKERLDGIRERLHKSIDEVQKKEDVDFEIF